MVLEAQLSYITTLCGFSQSRALPQTEESSSVSFNHGMFLRRKAIHAINDQCDLVYLVDQAPAQGTLFLSFFSSLSYSPAHSLTHTRWLAPGYGVAQDPDSLIIRCQGSAWMRSSAAINSLGGRNKREKKQGRGRVGQPIINASRVLGVG